MNQPFFRVLRQSVSCCSQVSPLLILSKIASYQKYKNRIFSFGNLYVFPRPDRNLLQELSNFSKQNKFCFLIHGEQVVGFHKQRNEQNFFVAPLDRKFNEMRSVFRSFFHTRCQMLIICFNFERVSFLLAKTCNIFSQFRTKTVAC